MRWTASDRHAVQFVCAYFANCCLLHIETHAINAPDASGATLQVLALCANRGPLACSPGYGYWKFFGVMNLPIIPYQAFKSSGGAPQHAPVSSPLQMLSSYGRRMGAAIIVCYIILTPGLPILLKHWFYALCVSLSLGAVFSLLGAFASAAFGITVAPSFDAPWLSTSFADYWSRRWNLTTTYMLRVMVYEPILEGRLVRPPTEGAGAGAGKAPTEATGAGAGKAIGVVLPSQAFETNSKPPKEESGTQKPSDGRFAAALAPAGELGTLSDITSSAVESAAGNEFKRDMSSQKEHLPRRTAAAELASHPLEEEALHRLDNASAAMEPAPGNVGMGHVSPSEIPRAIVDTSQTLKTRQKGGRRPSLLRRYLALQATFMFSAVWHLLIFWYMSRIIEWRWFVFFNVQAPILTLEMALKKWVKTHQLPQLPWALSVLLTNFLLIVIAKPIFFDPVDESDFSGRSFSAFEEQMGAIRAYAADVASPIWHRVQQHS